MQKNSKSHLITATTARDDLSKGFFKKSFQEELIEKAFLLPEMEVAVIGVDSGSLSAALVEHVRMVHLVDASDELLSQAKKNLAAHTNKVFHIAEDKRLPLSDASLDVIFANLYLNNTIDSLEGIQEMARVLKPGGRLIISAPDLLTQSVQQFEMSGVLPGLSQDQMIDWFKTAGLINIYISCNGSSSGDSMESDTSLAAKSSVFIAVGTKRILRKADVQKSYGLIAETGGGCGCNPPQSSGKYQLVQSSCCDSQTSENSLYQLEELRIIPAEAGEISLGCGNPLAMASLKSGETVLDIGSGGGIDVFLAANRVGSEGHVIGVDMTPAMLKRSRESALKHGYHQVEFRQGDAENLPVDDNSVDVVISNCVINLTEDKTQTFQEIYRVLKPGGRLEISDVVAAHALPAEVLNNHNQWAACVSGALPENEYLALITFAGFENLQTKRSNGYANNSAMTYSLVVSATKPAIHKAETI